MADAVPEVQGQNFFGPVHLEKGRTAAARVTEFVEWMQYKNSRLAQPF